MLDYKDWIGCQISDNYWLTKDGDPEGRALYERHYSCYRYRDGRRPKLFVGPGEKLVLISRHYGYGEATALFVWRDFISGDHQSGVNCAVFRNESPIRSSDLIREAEEVMQMCWPWHSRAYTYVNAERIASANPGYCFKRAGWAKCGTTQRGLHVLDKSLN